MSEFDAKGITGAPEPGGLARETNWWGAFVIGLSGTILIIPLVAWALGALGGFAIVLFGVLTAIGVFLCFCLAEMAATWPERSGGLPSYAFETFKPMGNRVATHVGGLSSWGYWIGWFAVAPINVFLAAAYFNDLFDIDFGGSFGPIHEKFGIAIPVDTFIVSLVFLLIMFVPCWLGIRFGAMFATVLGIGSIIPLLLLIALPLFKPSTLDFGNLDGLGFPAGIDGSFALIVAWAFIYTWTVLAMEAAACYIGECREPARDAKIALTAEGLFGFFVYVTLPIMVLAVLGHAAIAELGIDGNVALLAYVDEIFGASTFWEWFVGLALILALLLSVLNALMGASRGLYQNSHDGILPRAFGWVNKHGAPSFAILFSLACSIGVLCIGQILQIYIFSNMGYLFAVALSLVGYGIFRATRDAEARPLRMPVWFGPLGLATGVGFLLLWVVGGWYATEQAVGTGYDWKGIPTLFAFGLILLLLYFPLNWWRRMEDRSGQVGAAPPPEPEVAGG